MIAKLSTEIDGSSSERASAAAICSRTLASTALVAARETRAAFLGFACDALARQDLCKTLVRLRR